MDESIVRAALRALLSPSQRRAVASIAALAAVAALSTDAGRAAFQQMAVARASTAEAHVQGLLDSIVESIVPPQWTTSNTSPSSTTSTTSLAPEAAP